MIPSKLFSKILAQNIIKKIFRAQQNSICMYFLYNYIYLKQYIMYYICITIIFYTFVLILI